MLEVSTTHRSRRAVLKGTGAAGIAGLSGCLQSITGNSQSSTSITYRDRIDALSVYAEDFNKSQDSDFTVNPSMKPVQSNYRSLTGEISAGNAPEVVGLDVIFMPKFADLGALSGLGSFYNGLSYTNDIFEPLKRDFVRWNDSIYALPFWIDLSMFIYNKEHFKKAGLDPENPPVTFKEFLEAARALKSAGFKTPLANTLVETAVFFFLPHVWAGGGALLNEDNTKCVINEKPGVEALKFFLTLQEEGLVTDQTTRESWTHQAYISGETSMAYSNSQFGTIRNEDKKLYDNTAAAMFPKPSGGTQTSFLGGNCITITKQTKQNDKKYDAAKSFVEWVNSEEGMKTTVKDLGYVPARKSGFEMEFIQKNQDIYGEVQRSLEQGHAPPMHPKMTQINAMLDNGVQRALLKEQSPRKALDQTASEINNVL